jgi:hypothetical protein
MKAYSKFRAWKREDLILAVKKYNGRTSTRPGKLHYFNSIVEMTKWSLMAECEVIETELNIDLSKEFKIQDILTFPREDEMKKFDDFDLSKLVELISENIDASRVGYIMFPRGFKKEALSNWAKSDLIDLLFFIEFYLQEDLSIARNT